MTAPTVSTLTTVTAAHDQLRSLAEQYDWVSVFWDRGWGEDSGPAEISIIVDGDGQHPQAHLTPEVYAALREQQVIKPDTLKTYKARRLHDFTSPPEDPEPDGPTAGQLAEQIVREIFETMADKPLRASFYRGLDPSSKQPRILNEDLATPPHPDGRFVLILPAAYDAAISAQEPGLLGHDIIGAGIATVVRYPRTDDGSVDVEALRGVLVAEIENALAVIDDARASRA